VLDDLPAMPAELQLRVTDPRLANFLRDGELITGGMQAFVLGQTIPLGPAMHTPWARPLPGGPLRITVLDELCYNHDIAEIERRLDCRVIHASVPHGYYWARTHPDAITNYFSAAALEALQQPADVIIVSTAARVLPGAVAEAVAAKVEAGSGLVLIAGGRYAGGGQYHYWPLHEQTDPAWRRLGLAKSVTARYTQQLTHPPTPSGLFAGVPWEILPPFYLGRVEPADGVTTTASHGGQPLALEGRLGQGRVVVLPWGSWFGAFPIDESNQRPLLTDYQDYHASAVLRAVLHAAGRSVAVPQIEPTELAAGQRSRLRISQKNTEVRIRDLDGQTMFTGLGDTIELPALPAGRYLADLIARDAKGASLGWGSYVLNIAAPSTLAVTFDKVAYDPGTPARVEAVLECGGLTPPSSARLDAPSSMPEGGVKPPPTAKLRQAAALQNYAARLRVTDALGRLLWDEPTTIVDGRATWKFPNRDPLAVLHTAEVTVTLDGQPYLSAREELYVPRFEWNDFPNLLWGGYVPPYAKERVLRRLREDLGFEYILCQGYGDSHREVNRSVIAGGARPFYTNVGPQSPVETERAPQTVRDRVLKDIAATTDQIRQTGAAAVFFQDERHGSRDSETPTAEALPRFREWLQGRYADIGALNRAWGRSFAGFDEVMPVLTKEFDPTTEASLAPWLEWRLWAMHEIAETDRAGVRLLREKLGRDVHVGIEGIFGLELHNIPYGGTDLAAQGRDCFNTMMPYGEGLINACRTMYEGPITSWGGYSRTWPDYERYVWSGALQGYWGLGWFYGSTFYNAYDWYYPQARWVRDLTRPLREGIGRLLLENRPIQSEPIAFLYSQPSLYAMHILGKTIDPTNHHLMRRPAWWARLSLQKMFHDAGVQFGYVSEQDLQEGNSRGAKLLVLTSCVALEPATCRALEKFVADGGIVVADIAPGVWDDRGAFHQPGQLDELFGMKREGKFEFRTEAADWGVGTFEDEPDFPIKNQWFIGQYHEQTLQMADARALGKHIFGERSVPAFLFKRHGKGATVLMNYLETEYRRVADPWQKVLTAALLQLAGIQPPVVVRDTSTGGTPVTDGLILSRWQDGPSEYYGVLLDKGRPVRLTLPGSGHLYEVISGKYLGHGNEAEVDCRERPYALLARLPYRVERLQLTARSARLGESVPVQIVLPSGRSDVKHVVHLKVLRPDGSEYRGLTRNVVLEGGRWEGALPLALNDPTGKWQLQAREVVSGQTAITHVNVRK
jgi:hypothetical protein